MQSEEHEHDSDNLRHEERGDTALNSGVSGCGLLYLCTVHSAVSYKARARVLRWLRDPPCITQATLRSSPSLKLTDVGLYYDGCEVLCVLRSLRNLRLCIMHDCMVHGADCTETLPIAE